MSHLQIGALLLCMAFAIAAGVYTQRLHEDFLRRRTGNAIPTATLLGTLLLDTGSCACCIITWSAVVKAAPQSPAFSPYYSAEILLCMAGMSSILLWMVAFAIAGDVWEQQFNLWLMTRKPVALTPTPDPLAKHVPIKKHHFWWTLRRRLVKTWR